MSNIPRLLPALALLSAIVLPAQNAVTAGRFNVEPPTLINLGFDWEITGNANRNATVEVKFRDSGAAAWKDALPLLRIGREKIYLLRENLDYTVSHGFAGSILNLKPGAEYECQFTMKDPDGVEGQAVQTVKVRTRSEPQLTPVGASCTSIRRTGRARARSLPTPASCRPIVAQACGIGTFELDLKSTLMDLEIRGATLEWDAAARGCAPRQT